MHVKKHKKREARGSKADGILDAAAELFASRAFHEVRLEDIAEEAGVGKGTVYLYWSSKEEVYLAIIRRGFAAVLGQMDRELPGCEGRCWEELQVVVRAILDFAFTYPGVYRIMRSGAVTPEDASLQRIRRRLTKRIQGVIERGVESGGMVDPCPSLTAQFILSAVRGAFLYPPAGMGKPLLLKHMMHVLRRGLGTGGRG